MRRKEHRTLPIERLPIPRRALTAAAYSIAHMRALPTVAMLSMLLSASAGCSHADESIAADPIPAVSPPAPHSLPTPSSSAGATGPETFEVQTLPPVAPPPPPAPKPALKRHVPPRKIPVHLDGDVSSVKLTVKHPVT